MDETYTPSEMLAMVDKAIRAVMLGGQSYRIGTQSVTRADLALLRQMRSDLQAQIESGADSALLSNTFVAVFEGR